MTEQAAVTAELRPQRNPRLAERMAGALPDWMGSIRFRLTAIYSLVLFGLAALVVAGIYLALSRRLHAEGDLQSNQVVLLYGQGNSPDPQVLASLRAVQHLANERALEALRTYSFTALSLLFLSSLLVGWVVAGRVLAPIDRITRVARDIQATDLSRRIGLDGPPDELKNLADTFDAMLSRLDEAFEGQRRFIHEASHELRNPLAVVRTNLDVVLSDPEATPDELRQTGAVVRRAAERMSHLVDDLLVYADRGSPIQEYGPVDLNDVVADAAAEFHVPAESRGVHLVASGEPGLWVTGDPVALRRALANLLANAVRLAPVGSEVRVAAGRRGEWAWVAVDDAGPGIPAEQRDLVFQRFWRGDAQAARVEGRSGLGLTIVRQIAEGHRGEVRLVPSDRGGSTFVIWLPSGPAPEAS